MNVSVVIPSYNSAKTIGKCLSSLAEQTYPPKEIIVVDGKSTDSTIEIVRRFNDARLIINMRNHTTGSNRNRGAEAAKGDIVLFCDSDCIAHKKAMEYHLKAYTCEDIDGVAGAILNATPGNRVADFVQKEILANQWLRSLNPDGMVKYLQTSGTNMSMRRQEFLKRKFSEEPIIAADTELAIRTGNELRIIFEPRAILYHPHSTTIGSLFNQRKRYGENFFWLTRRYTKAIYKPGSLYHSALRFIDFPEEYLQKGIFEDNRLLCRGCPILRCQIDEQKLSREDESEKNLCEIMCLAFASGILKQRTGKNYELT